MHGINRLQFLQRSEQRLYSHGSEFAPLPASVGAMIITVVAPG